MDEPKLFPEQPKPEEHLKKNDKQAEVYQNMTKDLTTLGTRLRVLEEQYASIRNKTRLTDTNKLELEKDINKETRSMNEELLDLKKIFQNLNEKIDIIRSELGNTVQEHEFKVVEKYVDLWNPSRFVTKQHLREKFDELLDMINDKD